MMNSKLSIGSIVYGATGIGCKVLSIEGDTLTVENPNGTRTISSSKVVRVESGDADAVEVIIPAPKLKPRQLVLGDSVRYIGSHPSFQKQYGGVLAIWELGKDCDLDKCACLTPGGKVSTWIEYSALELLEVA
jgi:hypothetical protein